MTIPDAHGQIVVLNRASELEKVTRLMQEFGAAHQLPNEVVHDFCVAFDEVLSNIVKYGHRDVAPHEIHVRLDLAGASLSAEVSDDGDPFDPLSAPPPRLEGGLSERPIGGLGIYFVRKLMDEVNYARRGDRNVLVMKKQVTRRDTA